MTFSPPTPRLPEKLQHPGKAHLQNLQNLVLKVLQAGSPIPHIIPGINTLGFTAHTSGGRPPDGLPATSTGRIHPASAKISSAKRARSGLSNPLEADWNAQMSG